MTETSRGSTLTTTLPARGILRAVASPRAAVSPPPRLGSHGVAHYHFPRAWAARNDDHSHTFANGHVYDRAERRKSLRLLIGMMRRERLVYG